MLRKIVAALLLIPLALLIALFAVANRAPVTVSLDPFGDLSAMFSVSLPLFLLLLLLLILGVIIGGIASWMRQSRRPTRKHATRSSPSPNPPPTPRWNLARTFSATKTGIAATCIGSSAAWPASGVWSSWCYCSWSCCDVECTQAR